MNLRNVLYVDRNTCVSMVDHEATKNGVSFSDVLAEAGMLQPQWRVLQLKSRELSRLCLRMNNFAAAGWQPESAAFGVPLLVQLKALPR